jgi:probable rRNA maturation factor
VTARARRAAASDGDLSECARRSAVAWASRQRRPRGYSVALVRRALGAAFQVGGAAAPERELSVVFVDDEELASMHAEWLDDPSATDVITFDLGADEDGPAGELYVSVERALAVARARRGDPLRELLLYVVHGALHLCGFDDHDPLERRRMRAAERRAFAKLGAAASTKSGARAPRRPARRPARTRAG